MTRSIAGPRAGVNGVATVGVIGDHHRLGLDALAQIQVDSLLLLRRGVVGSLKAATEVWPASFLFHVGNAALKKGRHWPFRCR
jgi:hypothetical protein